MGTQYQFTVVKMKLIVLIALIGLAAAIPNPTQKKNMVQLTGLESQTTIHTSKKKNTDQPTDLESQITTTKKDTARDTTTQDATEEEPTEEEELASGEDAEVVTAEEVTPRDAESSTVKMVKL